MGWIATFSAPALAAMLLGAASLRAQPAPTCSSPAPTTRSKAEACLLELERLLQSRPSAAARAEWEPAAERLRLRLREGDFHPGERVYLRVAGESTLTDTLTVLPGPAIRLPGVGAVSLAGVLRGDLTTHLTDALGQFLRDPAVEAQALLRLSVTGEVAKPGFYAIRSATALADVLMLAGGMTQDAKADGMRIERGAIRIWEPSALRGALSAGHTVDDLQLQEGDRVVVPRNGGGLDTVLRVTAVVVSAATAVWLVSGR